MFFLGAVSWQALSDPIHAQFDGYSLVDLLDNIPLVFKNFTLVCFNIADWGL